MSALSTFNFDTLFGDTLATKDGTVATSTALADVEAIGIYFSAHWCPPCRGFTPKLCEKYLQLKAAGKKVEMIFVSSLSRVLRASLKGQTDFLNLISSFLR